MFLCKNIHSSVTLYITYIHILFAINSVRRHQWQATRKASAHRAGRPLLHFIISIVVTQTHTHTHTHTQQENETEEEERKDRGRYHITFQCAKDCLHINNHLKCNIQKVISGHKNYD